MSLSSFHADEKQGIEHPEQLGYLPKATQLINRKEHLVWFGLVATELKNP